MKLAVRIEDQGYQIDVPGDMLHEAQAFFDRMDRDMDQGWQMGREFVESPDRTERCRIVADKLYTAIETENKTLAQLMAGYLVSRIPGLAAVDIDTTGEMQGTEFTVAGASGQRGAAVAPGDSASSVPAGKLTKLEAMEQAGKDISKVYQVGRSYCFAVYDHDAGAWAESPPFQSEAEADTSRMRAFTERYEALMQRDAR